MSGRLSYLAFLIVFLLLPRSIANDAYAQAAPRAGEIIKLDAEKRRLVVKTGSGEVAVLTLENTVYAETAQEIRVQWDVYVGAPPLVDADAKQYAPAHLFAIAERRRSRAPMPQQRSTELSSDQMVVVAVDARGVPRSWSIIPDARVLRAEAPSQTGELLGQVLHHTATEFLVAYPDDPAVAALRFYHPRWTGAAFELELLGAVTLK